MARRDVVPGSNAAPTEEGTDWYALSVDDEAEQKGRFMARLDKPHKQWKFNAADVAERERWDDYMQAYEDAITATATDWAPWYVLPADHKRVMQAMASAIIVDTIGSLDLQWPTVSDEARDANANARLELEAEAD